VTERFENIRCRASWRGSEPLRTTSHAKAACEHGCERRASSHCERTSEAEAVAPEGHARRGMRGLGIVGHHKGLPFLMVPTGTFPAVRTSGD